MKSDSDLLAILNNQISNASGGHTSTVNTQKATALDYYYGDESLIDADEGESSIITREVLENVERELGQQLKVFASGERVVQFDPTGPEDEEQADQETDFINYIYNKENNGFKITHDWIKSALLEKVSYVKVWIEEKEEVETETYSDLNDMELAEILNRPNVEPLEYTAFIFDEMGNRIEFDDINIDDAMEGFFHDVKIKITNTEKKIRIEHVPGEEIGIYRNHNELSLKDCPFVFHKPQGITASDLIESGFDKETVKRLPGYKNNENELDTARNDNTDTHNYSQESDDSTREIEVYECYLRLDYDEDGVSELRKVTFAGNEILENEECDFIPFASLCPLPMPNKHVGLSYADMIMDVQDVKTAVMQQILTNLYHSNMPEWEVVVDQVNIDDVLHRKSGSVKRVKQPGMITPLTVPFTAGQSIPMLEILDQMVEARVGQSTGLDPDVLAKSTGTAFALGMEQANALSEKLARTFAETGFKELFRMIHELVIKNMDEQKVIKLRNKFVQIDPTEWKHRSNMSVVVGLGTGNRDSEMARLFAILEQQKEMLGSGLPIVDEKNIYNTLARLIERSELKDPSVYFTDPESPEAQQKAQMKAQQQQPNPLAEAEKVKGEFAIEKTKMETEYKGQLEQFKIAAKAEQDRLKAQYDAQLQAMKTQLDDRARELDRRSKEAITILQEEIKLKLAGINEDIGQPGTGAELDG